MCIGLNYAHHAKEANVCPTPLWCRIQLTIFSSPSPQTQLSSQSQPMPSPAPTKTSPFILTRNRNSTTKESSASSSAVTAKTSRNPTLSLTSWATRSVTMSPLGIFSSPILSLEGSSATRNPLTNSRRLDQLC